MTAFLPETTIHDLSLTTLNAISATCLGGVVIGLSAGVSAYGVLMALTGGVLLAGGLATLIIQHCSAMRPILERERVARAFEEAQPVIRAAERSLGNVLTLYLEMARPDLPASHYADGSSFLTLRPADFDPLAQEMPATSVDLLMGKRVDGLLSGAFRQGLMMSYMKLLERHIGAELASEARDHLYRRLITLHPMSQHERLAAYPEARRLFERYGSGS